MTTGRMTIADRTVLVTGANRGIGQALVEEALSRGAKRVYAGTRQPLTHPDGRVTPVTLDVTNAAQIQAAAGSIESLDVLINKPGLPRVRRASHLRRSGQRGRGHLPRSRVTVSGRELAQRRGQGTRAGECGVRNSRARRGISRAGQVKKGDKTR